LKTEYAIIRQFKAESFDPGPAFLKSAETERSLRAKSEEKKEKEKSTPYEAGAKNIDGKKYSQVAQIQRGRT
jgi:hypothetical protein